PIGQHIGLLDGAPDRIAPLAKEIELVAARERQPRAQRRRTHDEPPAIEDQIAHGRSPSRAIVPLPVRYQPVIIERISLNGPASTTITRWTMKNSTSSAMTMKWMVRAV